MFNPEIRKYYDDGAGQNTGEMVGDAISKDVPLIGGLVGGGISLVSGLIQKHKANQLLKQNPRPTMGIPAEELANQQAAQNMATEGMPSAQYQQANKNIQRQQAAAIADAQGRRSGGANVGAIQQETNDATGNLDAQSAAIRRQNQLNLQTVNSGVADYRQKAWDWNSKQKYITAYNYGNSLLGMGNANMMSGIDKIAGGLTQGAASGLFSGTGGGGASGGTPMPGANAGGYTPQVANTSSGGGSPASAVSMISTLAPLLL